MYSHVCIYIYVFICMYVYIRIYIYLQLCTVFLFVHPQCIMHVSSNIISVVSSTFRALHLTWKLVQEKLKKLKERDAQMESRLDSQPMHRYAEPCGGR